MMNMARFMQLGRLGMRKPGRVQPDQRVFGQFPAFRHPHQSRLPRAAGQLTSSRDQ
jgi:hypothetical protein